MTDTLLSPNETAPNHTGAATSGEILTCDWCPETFDKRKFGNARLGNHVKNKHPDKWQGAKGRGGGRPPASAKKVASAHSNKEKPATPAKPTTTTGRPPARVSIADRASWAWQKVGLIVQRYPTPQLQAVGNALVFEAPAAGAALDRALAGTRIDRKLIQRAAKAGERWEGVKTAITLPGLVFLIGTNPALIEVLEDDLREAIEDVLIEAIPVIEQKAARRRKAVDALARLAMADERYAGPDPIGVVMADLLAPLLRAQQAQAEDLEVPVG